MSSFFPRFFRVTSPHSIHVILNNLALISVFTFVQHTITCLLCLQIGHLSSVVQDLGRMCRYTKEDDASKLPYALIGKKLADELTRAALNKYSVFHGIYIDKGGEYLDKYCVGRKGMYVDPLGTTTQFM